MNKLFLACFVVVLASSCGSNSNHTTEGTDSTQKTSMATTSVLFEEEQTNAIYNTYMVVKEALISDAFDKAQKATSDLVTALNAKKGCETTSASAAKMLHAKDITAMRNDFVAVNAELVPFLMHQSLKSGAIYEQHCPMANEGNGANWISNENKVQNPYYGSEMLECGSSVDSLKK